MKLSNINKTYHNKNNEVCVFENLNLELPNHGCITIYGESGSGKTTLFQMIAGLDQDYEGTIDRSQKVEYLFQEIELFENLSVYDNLLFANMDNNNINDLLEKFDMAELKNQKVKKLSNGEKRRVQIMRSLLNEPDLLLMDEPSASLDQKNAVIVCDMIKQLSKEITVVITTHDEALFDDAADRSYRIEHLQLEMIKDSESLKNNTDKVIHIKKEKKKDVKQICKLYMKAHKWNMVISIVLLFCFCFSAYIGFYYNDASGEKQKHNTWKYSTNLIYTFPNNCEATDSENRKYYDCNKYDLFTVDSMNKTIDKNDEIIAYALVFGSRHIDPFDYESMEKVQEEEKLGKTFTPLEMTKRYFKPYYTDFQLIDNGQNDYMVLNPNTTEYLEILDIRTELYSVGKITKIIPYEMVQMEKFPLIAGDYPKKDNEIIIGNDFAESLIQVFNLESKEKLRGIKLNFSNWAADDESVLELLPDDWGTKDLATHVTISGVTSYENMFENRIYFRRNAFQSALAKSHHYDINRLNVEQEKFLIDPSKDTQTILDNLTENSPLVNDSYLIFNGEDNIYTEWTGKINQDQRMMKQIIVVLLIICIIFLMLHRFFFKKQLKKEAHILKQCGYSPLMIESIVNLCLCIITGILSLLLMIILIPLFNEAATALWNRSVLDWSIIYFIYSLLFIIIVYEVGTALYLKYLIK